MTKCKKCGVTLYEDEPQQNGLCVDCFAEEWGELVEISPIVSPRCILESSLKKDWLRPEEDDAWEDL